MGFRNLWLQAAVGMSMRSWSNFALAFSIFMIAGGETRPLADDLSLAGWVALLTPMALCRQGGGALHPAVWAARVHDAEQRGVRGGVCVLGDPEAAADVARPPHHHARAAQRNALLPS